MDINILIIIFQMKRNNDLSAIITSPTRPKSLNPLIHKNPPVHLQRRSSALNSQSGNGQVVAGPNN